MPAVELVDVYMADQAEVAVHQSGMRLNFIDGIVDIEHGADGGARDLADQAGGLGQRLHHVALSFRKRLDQDGDAALLGMRRNSGKSLHIVACGLLAAPEGNPSAGR